MADLKPVTLTLKVQEIETCADGSKLLKFGDDRNHLLCPADIFDDYFESRPSQPALPELIETPSLEWCINNAAHDSSYDIAKKARAELKSLESLQSSHKPEPLYKDPVNEHGLDVAFLKLNIVNYLPTIHEKTPKEVCDYLNKLLKAIGERGSSHKPPEQKGKV